MPYYTFREIWTPLKLIGLRLFLDEDNSVWAKWGRGRRHMVWRRRSLPPNLN